MEKLTQSAQEAAYKIPQTAQENLASALQSLADNIEPIMDKLAGTQSTITLSFKDLTLDTGKAKATLTGTINLKATSTEKQGRMQTIEQR
ncbi:hypothetical protein GX563_00185 [Candidatus Bathyarchaeota archaeon]|nr:hypothetical protein [Candidatus Bathyarchaeota archaeon]